ncbi:S26 family signal peptidase [Pseudonocardia sp. GCM10023141]|uniref:S26 family signal peptidase n=1 Tax=Pseudonocardia sp. GCM10023141 TaxID=3252653 RepID=UPI003621A7C9
MRAPFVAVAALVALAAAARLARRSLVLVSVIGDSMEPTLFDGDRILVRRRLPAALRRGDIAVLAGPDLPPVPGLDPPAWQVKRIVALAGDPAPVDIPMPDGAVTVPAGTVVVLGDNPAGGDSRQLGPYPAGGLVGTFVCRSWSAPR